MSGIVLPPAGADPDDVETLFMRPQARTLWFVCPVCRNRASTNLAGEGAEPVCTGPHSWDEHPHTVMVRVQ